MHALFPRRLPILVAFLGTLGSLSACTGPEDQAEVSTDSDTSMDTLVSAAWLREHLDDPDLVVIDATVLIEADDTGNLLSVNGRESYAAGHIPGAVFADLMGDLSDTDSNFEFAVPSPEQFAAAMEALGVGDDSRVVLYDRTPWSGQPVSGGCSAGSDSTGRPCSMAGSTPGRLRVEHCRPRP